MMVKINNSALFLSILVTLIYAGGWVLFSMLCASPVHFSVTGVFSGLFYLTAATMLVYFLISRQLRRNNLLLSRLAHADETLEKRVRLRTAELESALKGIKQLKGIIPICANCKSIRNGSGEWEQIESYLRKYSDAEFSHGLCPDCDKKLYGDRRAHFKAIAGKYA
jgi:hypothetical protein